MIPGLSAQGVVSVSVGVCAYNEAERVRGLLGSLLDQVVSAPFRVDEIIVVASGCTDGTGLAVRQAAGGDARVRLIEEPERRGKASALNQILGLVRSDLLVLVNADARLAPGSLAGLLRVFVDFPQTAVACGAAVPEPEPGLPHSVESVLWSLHNRVLAVQSQHRLENHCCDEFMAIRRGFVDSLPPDLINDGAYLGVLAGLAGQSVHFCEEAPIWVRTPRSVRGLLERRRRILRGHRQVRRILHRAPNTLESLAARKPSLAARIMAREVLEHPRALPILLLAAVPLEVVAAALAASDEVLRPGTAAIWPKVDTL